MRLFFLDFLECPIITALLTSMFCGSIFLILNLSILHNVSPLNTQLFYWSCAIFKIICLVLLIVVILVYSLRKKWIRIAKEGNILIRLSPEGKIAEVCDVMWKDALILEFENYYHRPSHIKNGLAWKEMEFHLSWEEKSVKIFIPVTLSLYSSKSELNDSDWEEVVKKIIKGDGKTRFDHFFCKKFWEGEEKGHDEIMAEIKKFREKIIDKEAMKKSILEILQKNLQNAFCLSFISKAKITAGEPIFEASLILS